MQPHSGEIRYVADAPPETGQAIEVADGVLWMRLPLSMPLNHVNVYALEEDDGWSIVDTGVDHPKLRGVWDALLKGPLGGRPIRRVIVTHHHPDHIGLAGWFQTNFGAELVTTRTAWLFARMLQLDDQDRPTPESVAFWRGAGMASETLADRVATRPFNFADVVAPMPLGFKCIREGDVISAGGRQWRVRIGNGHAPEHATLWSETDNLVVGGDQFLPSISPNLGVYATEPEADPVAEWLESCSRLSAFSNDSQLVLPGHKLPYRGLPTRLRQLEVNHHSALDRLRQFLSEPRTAVECFTPLFRREISDGEYGLAMVEAVAHVLHLWHKGEVRRSMRDDGVWLWQLV
jgi:glyoxylase-like metal-dependent hydrolase (beta-lactamase superfamily II)